MKNRYDKIILLKIIFLEISKKIVFIESVNGWRNGLRGNDLGDSRTGGSVVNYSITGAEL